MSLLTPVIRDALTGGHLAHLVTVNADGSPQVSIVWLGLDGDDLVTAHLSLYQKLRNVERDPRVVVSMETGGSNQIGMAHYLVVHGTARIVEGGAPELLQRLAHVYLGPDVTFPPMPNPPAGYVLHITPERIGGVGPWS